jgi:hypothetical protein
MLGDDDEKMGIDAGDGRAANGWGWAGADTRGSSGGRGLGGLGVMAGRSDDTEEVLCALPIASSLVGTAAAMPLGEMRLSRRHARFVPRTTDNRRNRAIFINE